MDRIIKGMEMVLGNSEQVPQELTRPKNGESEYFEVALKAIKILNATVEELKEALRYAMVKIGLRSQNWPSEEEKMVLIHHILKNYGGHTVEEIKLAFDMAITGRLNVEVNCYENFSCLYFSNIMAAYREWAKEEYKQVESKHLLPLIENKEDMSQEAMTDWFNVTVKKIKAGELLVEFVPLMLYEFMDDNGNITATAKEKHVYLARAVEYRIGKLREAVDKEDTAVNRITLANLVKMRDAGCLEGDEISRAKDLAKKILLYETILNS